MKANKLTKETILSLGLYNRKFDNFKVGDSIKVSQIIKEFDKERIQDFEGDVIQIRKNGIATTFTVRKIGPNSVAIERIFPLYSPMIQKVTFMRPGNVRRAKLFYMRNRIGKAAYTPKKRLLSSQKNKDVVTENTVKAQAL